MRCLTLIVMVLFAGCVIHAGPGPDTYPPAHSAFGVVASLMLASSRVDGELLEARDTALVILTRDRVVLVPFSTIDSGSFAHSKVAIGHGRKPPRDDFDTVRLLSRYPQGIPPEALRRILANRQQDVLVLVP